MKKILGMEMQTFLPYLFIALFIIGAILHNIGYALAITFGGNLFLTALEVAFFLIGTIVAPIGFILSIGYNFYTYLTKRVPKDVWKLGFIGFFGIATSLIFGFNPEMEFAIALNILFLLPFLFFLLFIYMK